MLGGRLARRLLTSVSRRLPFPVAMTISRELMRAQGFGSGERVDASGEMAVLEHIRSDRPVLFDVGGHLGDYTDAFLRRFPDGRAFIFEPATSHLARLQKRFSGHAATTLFPFGLSDAAASLPLFKDAEVTVLASLTRRQLDHIGITMEAAEMVEVRTLDSVVDEHAIASIDLLKIDVEGHELQVLNGARRTLERGIIRLVQFEFGGCNLDTHTTLRQFYTFFQQFGFEIMLVQPSGRLQPIKAYDEFYEHYRTTNFVARPA